MNKFFVFLVLVCLLSACSASAPLPPPMDTLSNTPAPTPTSMATVTQISSPTPSNASPTNASLQHSGLKTSGPYLAYLRSQTTLYAVSHSPSPGRRTDNSWPSPARWMGCLLTCIFMTWRARR